MLCSVDRPFIWACVITVALLWLLCGCMPATRAKVHVSEKIERNGDRLGEESRALTTGALDALGFAPTNPPTDLARTFLRRDQQIEGMPVERIDVAAILATNTAAIRSLQQRFDQQDGLLRERVALERDLEAAKARLVEMGQKYEAERSKSIWRRILGWMGLTGTVAAVVALFVFCPPAAMIVFRLGAWLVGKVPAMASFLGVVGTKAFDQVVQGVEDAKASVRESGGKSEVITDPIARRMDAGPKALVRARRAVVGG
jgi:hypothetical protein